MKVRYVKRGEVLVLQRQVMTHRDEDGTRHYDWEDVPTVELDT